MAEKPDPELDELLASAAADFAKAKPESTPAPANFDPSMMLNPDGSFNAEKWKAWQEDQRKAIDSESKKADEEFANSDLGKELGLKLQEGFAAAAAESGLSTDELNDRLKSLNMLVESAIAPGAAAASGADVDKDFSEAIMGAMQSLKANLSEAFPAAKEGEEGDGQDASGNEMENLTTFMQQMMLSLLSKELLLPPFKELSEKYPAWLEENKSKISEEDFKRYTEQLEVTREIVAELEKEGSEDDKQHLDTMVKLMGKAQDLGQPPPDLAAQLGNAIDDTKIDAMLKDSGADQCNIM
ncbi:peroxisomal biogenesis factor 19 isoform X1 [Frankliniella occidentalis]|uniref:Peroxin-19 n=1 Tax=Frankliniella occidentalis TaxID=133901 RepID=A0A6J1SC12_FRAOC|nr:peroxisomal biogenesis factor 19 isoform X1 [Frankliniella occidentalis]